MLIFAPFNSFNHLVYNLLTVVLIALLLDVIMSYVVAYNKGRKSYEFAVQLHRFCAPILSPIKAIMPPPHKTMNVDFSSMIAMILIQIVRSYFV